MIFPGAVILSQDHTELYLQFAGYWVGFGFAVSGFERGLFIMRWLLAFLLLVLGAQPVWAQDEAETLALQSFGLFSEDPFESKPALDALVSSGRADAAPVLILALRLIGNDRPAILAALGKLTGANPGTSWEDWMHWQEAHPEIGVIPGFAKLQAQVFGLIDPNFQVFLNGEQKHEIRLEEIAWGGVPKDGIPALTNPRLIEAKAASYLNPDDLVFGVSINGDVRAYPLRIMDWHEMFNDVIGGVPVSLAYCTLCASAILFETAVSGRQEPLIFGSSGFLYRSNKLMYDTQTNSLWNQFTGRPVVGPLTGSGIELKTRPVVITRWSEWAARHPQTRVLDPETGHRRDYTAGGPYGEYFASPDLMFPTNTDQKKLKQKDLVFALRSSGVEKAWPLRMFDGGAVINDSAGMLDLVLIGNQATKTVRAYRSDGLGFVKGAREDQVSLNGETWQVTEDALVSPNGKSLSRLPGHIAYWFAWSGYFGDKGELASDP